ncbi:MAG: hypothetical protein IH571_02750 [Acholeplasmataceae bacterium]|nr:hypothetical protein [Acholeplasmataceae bacterium]
MTKKVYKKFLMFFFVLLLFSLFFSTEVFAIYTGPRAIEPTSTEFNNAKNTLYSLGANYTRTTTNGSYRLFYYKTEGQGAYNIFTTGTTDTVGALFEQKYSWGTATTHVGEDDDSGAGLNFRIEKDLKANKNYFVGVRGYDTRSGTYTLRMEKNVDAAQADSGGQWVQNSTYVGRDHVGYSQESAVIRTFYTHAQTVFYYFMLEEEIHARVVDLMKSGPTAQEKIVEYLQYAIGLAVSLALPPLQVGQLALSLSGLVASIINSYIFGLAPNQQSTINELESTKAKVYLAAGGQRTISNGMMITTFASGFTEETYKIRDTEWFTWVLLPFGLISNGGLITIPRTYREFTPSLSNYIYGRELERGELTIHTFTNTPPPASGGSGGSSCESYSPDIMFCTF